MKRKKKRKMNRRNGREGLDNGKVGGCEVRLGGEAGR